MTKSIPLWKKFLAFLGPMVLSNILQALSGTVNNIYYGQMLGVDALAAVTAFFPIVFFFISFVIGIGAGASILIGQAYGAGEVHKIKAVSGAVFAATILFSLAITVLGLIFLDPILLGLGTPSNILGEAARYSGVMLIGTPVLLIFILATMVTRGVGDSVTPLIALAVSTVIGLAATPALIKGWFGLPETGIEGGAWAMILSCGLSLVWISVHLIRKNHPLAPDREFLRDLRINVPLLALVLRLGIPIGLQMVVIALSEIALLAFVNGFGSDATAAYGALGQIISYVQFPALSIAITASVFGAQAIGAGKRESLGAIARTAMWLNLIITGSLVVLGYVAARSVLGLFLVDTHVIDLARDALYITLWAMVMFGVSSALSGLMRSSGDVYNPTLIVISAIIFVEVPLAWFLSRAIGLNGVWISYPTTGVVVMLAVLTYYHLVWSKKTFKRLY